jgi:putative ABC transport system permease protein
MTSSTFVRDSRHAFRALLRAPGFTAIAALTFGLGIGVNTAVFSVFDGVVLRPLPYPEPDRITMVWMDNRQQGIKEDITSWPNYQDWRNQNSSFAVMAGYTGAAFNLTGADEPERLQGAQTTANFFDVMGVRPLLGRLYTDANETPGNDGVVLLSYGLWQRKFGGSNDVLGKTMTLNGRTFEIIGVLPATLRIPPEAQVWKPLAPDEGTRNARGAFWLPVIGRLKPGISVLEAQTEMTGIATRLEQTYPSNQGFGINVVPLHRQLVGDIERSLVVLLASVGFVLLIACANLGNLMLGRTAARRKELAIRTALGAGRARLVRQIVTEALVLAAIGSALGLMFAWWATRLFIRIGGDSIPRPDAIAIDVRVMLFTLGIAVVAALLAGIVPALQASRPAVVESLREGGREGGSGASRRTRHVLIAIEVALAFMLLAVAGLLLRTLWSMQNVDRGFSLSRIATMRLSLPGSAYAGPPEVRAFYSRLLERVRALPGVESAATGTGVLMPLLASSGIMTIEGRPPTRGPQIEYPREIVSPGYFETLGVTLAAGRTFTEQDHAEATLVTVINETFARSAWPDQDPLGRRVRFGGAQSKAPWLTVIGVVRDLRRSDDVRRAVRPEVYMCTLQNPPRSQMLLVRTATDPNAIVTSVRHEVQAINPQLPLFAVGTLEGQISETLTTPRFRAVLLAGFAVIALLLATIGIYGVTAHAVGQRTHEVGIRMALGAERRDVLGLILVQHLKPALIGVTVGVVGAIILSQSLRTFIYGIRATDPLTFIAMAIALIAVAVVACWVPARRATRVDPLVALRTE